MDPATLIGIVLTFAAVIGSMIMDGGDPMAIVKIPAFILIFGGTLSACLASNTLPGAIGAFKWAIYAITAKKVDMESVVAPLVKLAEKARKEGLLALESELDIVEDPFMKKGLQMAVDGTDPDDLYEILTGEVKAKKASANRGGGFFTDAGGYSPTIGIIGTVLGLVHVLKNLSNPGKLGELIAAAFVATLWGILSANALFLPLGKRIKLVGANEAARMEVIIEGVLAIQAGANPRVVGTKLRAKIIADAPASGKEEAA